MNSGALDDWWKAAVIYQVYPRSFQDTTGDGIGDLKGIERRLPYLAGLGVDAVWLSPIYRSPMADFGYDISDHTAVDPLFGTLADFDALVRTAHGLGLKLILDFVPNHTSDQHPWFIDSRSSRSSARRDWYIWRDPAPDGGPPNNWLSSFGGSGWAWDEATGQYYYHAFLKQQPDLNWRNPAVRDAMFEVLRFWLDRGVDGFRIDVLWHLIKDDRFGDNPPNPAFQPGHPGVERFIESASADRPEVHALIAQMRRFVDAWPGRVLIGEIYLPLERLVRYYGEGLQGVQLPFNFLLLKTPWDAAAIAALVRRYEDALPPGAWPNWVLGNHDRPRVASRVGPAQAAAAAMLLLTLHGTPTLYYGDELALQDVNIPPQAIHDPWEKQEPGLGLGRDPVRTPMPWDASPNAGFSSGEPWLPLNPDWPSRNVASLGIDAGSILNLYRRLLALRRERAALRSGACAAVAADHGVLRFERMLDGERLLVALNLTAEPRRTPSPTGRLLLSSHGRDDGPSGGQLSLGPNEGVVIEL